MKTFDFNFPLVNYTKISTIYNSLVAKAPAEMIELGKKYFAGSEVSVKVSVKGFLETRILSAKAAKMSPAGVQFTSTGEGVLYISEEMEQALLKGCKKTMTVIGHEYGHLIDMSVAIDIDSYNVDEAAEKRCDAFAAMHFGSIEPMCEFFQEFTCNFRLLNLPEEVNLMVEGLISQRIDALKALSL